MDIGALWQILRVGRTLSAFCPWLRLISAAAEPPGQPTGKGGGGGKGQEGTKGAKRLTDNEGERCQSLHCI